MSAAGERRPQRLPQRGRERAVLVIPRDGTEDKQRLTRALDEIARLGWVLTAVIDPAEYLDALRMILDGLADVVLASRPEHMPALQFIYNIDAGAGRRSQLLARPVAREASGAPDRRPGPDHPWRKQFTDPRPVERETPPSGRYRRSEIIRRPA